MKIILFSVLVFLALSCAEEEIHQPYEVDDEVAPKIIGGQGASIGQFPWQVTVLYTSRGNRMICGGTLISNRWVLTAAHCLYKTTDYQVILGVTNLFSKEAGEIQFNISQANGFSHDKYNTTTYNNDVGLLRLPRAVRFTRNIRPLRLARSNDYLKAGVNVTVSGWGRYDRRIPNVSRRLLYTNLITIANNECVRFYNAAAIQKSNVCASRSATVACHGDSGGALIAMGPNRQPIHVGIVSFGHQTCQLGFPVAFARTSSYISYINRITRLNFR